jgi:predicted NAD-dependent protein-ADP-ribosyltransferase YbiA (DUF1768 family)
MSIYFFRPYDNYGFLSNWWKCSFKGTEQYFMAYKAYYFGDTESFNRILQTHSPLDAKTIGSAVKNFNIPERIDWESCWKDYEKSYKNPRRSEKGFKIDFQFRV